MKQEQTELLNDLKRVATELGKVPSRDEYDKHGKHGRREVDLLFGTFTQFLQAAGLGRDKDSCKSRREDIKRAYQRDLKADLASRQPSQRDFYTHGERMIFLPDVHAPFMDMNALSMVYAIIEDMKPSLVCQLGDSLDQYSQSKFAKTLSVYTPQQEIEIGRRQLEDMWSTINKMVPEAKKIQLLGNHCVRPLKKLFEKSPELEPFFSLEPWLKFDGVETIMDPRQIVMINDSIEVTHGHWSKAGEYAASRKHCVIHGHTHRGGITYVTLPDGKVVWEAAAGHLSDDESIPLSYTPKSRPNWQKGVVVLDGLGPRFVAF